MGVKFHGEGQHLVTAFPLLLCLHLTPCPALLPPPQIGLDYAFWSAFQVTQNMQQLKAEAAELGVDVYDLKAERKREQEEEREALRRERGEEEEDERIRVLDGEELLELLEYKARLAVEVWRGVEGYGFWVWSCSSGGCGGKEG